MWTSHDEDDKELEGIYRCDGDLRNWEYLTRTYDHEDIFAERSPVERKQSSTGPSANEPSLRHETLIEQDTNNLPNQLERPTRCAFSTPADVSTSEATFDPSMQDDATTISGSTGLAPPLRNTSRVKDRTSHHVASSRQRSVPASSSHFCNDESVHLQSTFQPLQDTLQHQYRQTPQMWEREVSKEQDNLELALSFPVPNRSPPFRSSLPTSSTNEPTAGSATTMAPRASSYSNSETGSEPHRMAFVLPSQIPHHVMCRPFTAYNYFYRDEKDNIVAHLTKEGDPLPEPVGDFSDAKLEALLQEHWFVDPVKKKRSHRKTHGKIQFTDLSKVISERWGRLSLAGREFYRRVAQRDSAEYQAWLVAKRQRFQEHESRVYQYRPEEPRDDHSNDDPLPW